MKRMGMEFVLNEQQEMVQSIAKEYAVQIFTAENFPIGEALIFTKQGMVKRTSFDELNVSKSAYKAINLTAFYHIDTSEYLQLCTR